MVRLLGPDLGPPGQAPPPVPTDGSGFDEFYAANFHQLTLQLYAYTADVGQAQDAVQEAFSRAWARWSRVASYDNPAAWVRRVALNVAKSRWRRLRAARAHAHFHREQVVEGPGPDRVALARALADLPETHRRAIVLFHVADMPVDEIAKQEGVSSGTVKSWLHRGRKTLAAALTDPGTERTDA
ncbi:sigma-70 family RNA polymerase sigma factor [Micromonospora echinofusca]|uniref:Sigma-70 family RNA polymerase sigma factor n=1 Tax=Micromonospora echinofusca TaxID=47858 RepID=A0ABS3VKQ7_MICEH|nr:SigE family RNA polymerase sigma factor [Micromonospora echinofusca]MBO4205118.1 sigma-70 family RNA polymerase sigma factor [Micromonospora echinofusca]